MANCGSALALLHIYLVLLEVQLYCMEIIPFKETHVIVKIANYLKILKRCHKDAEIAIVSPRDDYARDIIDYFLDGNSDIATAVLFDINVLPGLSKNLRPNNYYIFVTEFENVIPYLKVINDTSATYLIVICHNEWKSTSLTSMLMQVWMDYRILRFALVSHSKNIDMVTYNPFKNEVTHFSGDPSEACALFPQKMLNLYRQTLKVTMFSVPPTIIVKNGKLQGRIGRTLNIIAEKLNARIAIVIPKLHPNVSHFECAKGDVKSGKTEFSLMPYFAAEDMIFTQQNTYPHRRDDLLVVTKNYDGVVEYSSIYECFDLCTWINLAAFCVIVSLVRKFLSEDKNSYSDAFLHTWAGLINAPLPSIFDVNRKIKFVFTWWILCSLVTSSCFSSFLLRSLLKPIYKENINTIKELAESNFKIFIPSGQVKRIPRQYGITHNLIPVETTDRKRIFEKFPSNSAIALKETILESYLDECVVGKSEVHILKEHLLPSLSVHYFREQSPFRDIVDEIIHKMVQSGLTKPTGYSAFCNQTQKHNNRNATALTLEHYKSIFKLLLVCHSIATIVFIFEVFKKFLGQKVKFVDLVR